jgi:hypothetical protein
MRWIALVRAWIRARLHAFELAKLAMTIAAGV